ncbi:collagen-like protein [Mammaliicoccus lentus]|uniref:collagen-like protein n=1 Tax=Mammaliicoccus lentus TaxID=42858 RepID=UPI0010723152|nr:collagen-like protein [Mammaliicoccus lentus]MBF0793438.1 collagen-like protein [Mammaliicoccus lentus]TFV17934.1 collagen-like protein [Mammaliicoccus lentus]
MKVNTVSNLKFKDFNDSKVIQIKQGDTTPIAVKLDNSPSMIQSKEKATIYLSNKDKNVVFKNQFEVNKGVVTFFVNQVLPANTYSLQINYLGKKYPSVDSYYLRINPSADIAPEDIKDLETIEMIEEMILESVNSKVHEQVANTIHNEVATYLEENADKFKGKDGLDGLNGRDGRNGIDGKSFTFDDLTEEQKESLKGQQGTSGLSAYEIAHLNGFEGSEEEWLVSLQGKQGSDGSQGIDGKSAYQIAVENGYEGSQTDWLASLKGDKGEKLQFEDLTEEEKLSIKGSKGDKGDSFTFDDFTSEELELLRGQDGKDFTYEDFTPEQLELLKGKDGTNGKDGLDGKSFAFEDLNEDQKEQLKGNPFTYEDFTEEQLATLKGKDGINGKDGNDGSNGKSAYDIALDEGFVGSLSEWLDSLKGKDGEQGIKGADGARGADGKSITVKSTTTDSSGNTLVTFSDNSTVVVAKGTDGVNGSDGINGKDGIDGKDGKSLTFDDLTSQQKLELKGAKGDKGDRGEKGVDGLKGDKGDKGDPFKYTDFTQEQLQSLKGAKGDTGAKGADGKDGKDGIQYDTTNWQKYKMTNDDGTRKQITLANNIDNLHNLDTGYYYATGTPITGASSTAGLLTVEMNGVKTVKFITFRPYNSSQLWVKRYYNAWDDWERVDLKIEDLNIQKHKLTEENGDRIRISDIDPVNLESGFYQMWRMKNAPVGSDNSGSYWNIDVTTAFDDVKQIKAVLSYTGQTFQKNMHKGNDSGWKELIDNTVTDKIYKNETAPIYLYVRKTGSDITGDGSTSNPYQTIQKAVDTIPKIINQDYEIKVGKGNYDEQVVVKGISGCAVWISREDGIVDPSVTSPEVKVTSIGFFDCNGYCRVNSVEQFNASKVSRAFIRFSRVTYGTVHGCKMADGSITTRTLEWDGAGGGVNNCYFNNQRECVTSLNGSKIRVDSTNKHGNTLSGKSLISQAADMYCSGDVAWINKSTTPLTMLQGGNINRDVETIELALKESWKHYSDGYKARARKFGDGTVRLDGIITGGNVGQGKIAFVLPSNFKPAQNQILSPYVSDNSVGKMLIDDEGSCAIEYATAGKYVSLSNISFYTGQ